MKRTYKIILISSIIIIIAFIAINVWLNVKPDIVKINNCNIDSACVLVKAHYCGGAEAINKDYINKWDNYLKRQDINRIFPWVGSTCSLWLGLDAFEAQCVENKCSAVQVKMIP